MRRVRHQVARFVAKSTRQPPSRLPEGHARTTPPGTARENSEMFSSAADSIIKRGAVMTAQSACPAGSRHQTINRRAAVRSGGAKGAAQAGEAQGNRRE